MNSNFTQIMEKQVLRGMILKISNAAEPLGAGTDIIQSAIKQYGYSVSKEDILIGCKYLQGKGLVIVKNVSNEVLGISRDIVHITSKGIDVLEGTVITEGIELID